MFELQKRRRIIQFQSCNANTNQRVDGPNTRNGVVNHSIKVWPLLLAPIELQIFPTLISVQRIFLTSHSIQVLSMLYIFICSKGVYFFRNGIFKHNDFHPRFSLLESFLIGNLSLFFFHSKLSQTSLCYAKKIFRTCLTK